VALFIVTITHSQTLTIKIIVLGVDGRKKKLKVTIMPTTAIYTTFFFDFMSCLVSESFSLTPITSMLRQMHGVLNVD
jgi:hypothetical protein